MNIFDILIKRRIPEEVYQYSKKVMHITDTPNITYSYIKRLIKIIEPDIIIHTGDLVDNIKLEITRSDISNYERQVKRLMDILRSREPEKIIICKGNHDDEEIIKKYLVENETLFDDVLIDIDNKRFFISHYCHENENDDFDFFLYGHSPDFPTNMNGRPKYLNGLTSIYIIDSISGKIAEVPYPKDTDDFRQRKFKLGF